MNVATLLFRWGITSWQQDIITILPTTPANSFQIGKNLPTDVGFIYGISMYADGADADGNQLLSTTQASNMYLTLQNGASQFFEQIRLDDLLNVYAGSPVVRPYPYMPVNLPIFDLSKSYYSNPNSYASNSTTPTTLRLKLWYIQKNEFNALVKAGLFGIHSHAHHAQHGGHHSAPHNAHH